ncbi:tyrosine-type recombinase/integrase [Arthrobacter koreensis]|uniref:tyrosine-type recombinase/integrase n=1 Tax=Arthrobacter koreensis TaxID=199136 RepID=UPI0036DAE771
MPFKRARRKCGLEPTGLVDASFWRSIQVGPDRQGSEEGFQKLAGFKLREGDQDFRSPVFHDLRHTAVSLYLSVTKNVKHVQRIAGHKDATTTLNTYAELFDDDFYNSAESLTSLMAG